MAASCGLAYGASGRRPQRVRGMEDEVVSASTGSVVWSQAQGACFDPVNHLARVTPRLHTPTTGPGAA